MTGFTLAHDATHENISKLPAGQVAGYTTGSAEIMWITADWASHPGAVRICQDHGSDLTADVLDVEQGAATDANIYDWLTGAWESFNRVTRPGQRKPAIYVSLNSVPGVVKALRDAGVQFSSVRLWLADWNFSQSQATQDLLSQFDGLMVIGVQYSDPGPYDDDVFATAWLTDVSKPKPLFYRVKSNGEASLHQVAKSRHATVRGLTMLAAAHLTESELVDFCAYLGDGNWSLCGKSGANLRMPYGLVYVIPAN